MTEVYRKRGQTIRFEHGCLIRVGEAGEATEDGERFTAAPLRDEAVLPEIDDREVLRVTREIESLVRSPARVERLIISHGIAEHEFGEARWREEARRVHLSITYGTLRALIDLGDFDLDDVQRVAAALPRAGSEREPPRRMSLRPNVSAAILPSLARKRVPGVVLRQSPIGLDGKGAPVQEALVENPPWPNWYRPSYRVRPVRMPFHLRAECVSSDVAATSVPEAVALLAPLGGAGDLGDDSLALRVLCIDGHDVYPTTIGVTGIRAVARETRWYPYGAGALGASMLL